MWSFWFGGCIIIKPNNPAYVSVSGRTFLFLFLFLQAGLFFILFLLASFCFYYVYVLPERLTHTSDVYVLFLFLFLLFMFSLCSISVLGSHVYVVYVSADRLLGLIIMPSMADCARVRRLDMAIFYYTS